MRIAGHTLGTPEQTVPEALALFAAAGLDAAEVIYQDGYRSGLPLRDRRSAEQARRLAADSGNDAARDRAYHETRENAIGQSAVRFRHVAPLPPVVAATVANVTSGRKCLFAVATGVPAGIPCGAAGAANEI